MPVRSMRERSQVVAVFILVAASAMAQAPVPRAWLLLERVGQYGRSVVHRDPVEAAIVAGEWRAPRTGDTVMGADGKSRAWREVIADEEGNLSDPQLAGGYLYARVEAPTKQVAILSVRGHAVAYVNGIPRTGDPYGAGWARFPVMLQSGSNDLLLLAAQSGVSVALEAARPVAEFDLRDVTAPDLIAGEKAESWLGVPVLNTTDDWLRGVQVEVGWPDGSTERSAVPPLPPLARRKVVVALRHAPLNETGEVALRLRLLTGAEQESAAADTAEVKLAVRGATDKHKRTFISTIDGSVQYYAVTPALLDDGTAIPALLLTLHGASVEATNQANAYAHKDWIHIVAPTNRRPYGFDWEDWGRQDALEVLEVARATLRTDPERTYLAGHSMGGHGTWQIGAHYPDHFAAIAPSAGWVSFWSYTGAEAFDGGTTVEQLLRRAASPSDTLALARNYLQHGLYILHGDQDDNVPVEQARTMRAQLGGFHTDFAYYERPGAGHWWGNECVDWPPLFDFLRVHTRRAEHAVRTLEFVTASPGISARCHWATIASQLRMLRPASVELKLVPPTRKFTGKTENVGRLVLELAELSRPREGGGEPGAAPMAVLPAGAPLAIALDGHEFEVPWPPTPRIWLERQGDTWQAIEPPRSGDKGPHRYGPLRAAFDRRVVFVVGTAGTAAETAWALAKARYDAETFGYRGNGSVDIVLDTEFAPGTEPDRSVILYGNAETNHVWGTMLGDSPIQIHAGKLVVGAKEMTGSTLAALFVRPRRDSEVALVAAIGGTGLPGMRLTERLPLFTSGVGWPDCIVMDTEMLATGVAGVRAAGFFGTDWSVESGEFGWGDE